MKHYVYVLINEYGIVEYVGESRNTKKRLKLHKTSGLSKFHGRTDITLEVVKEFDNRKDALKYEGELKKQLGFEWTEKTRISKGQTIANKIKSIPVIAYDKVTSEYIGTYESYSECARYLGLQEGNIGKYLNGLCENRKYTFKKEND